MSGVRIEIESAAANNERRLFSISQQQEKSVAEAGSSLFISAQSWLTPFVSEWNCCCAKVPFLSLSFALSKPLSSR
jgi:hypothetical protein